MTQIPGSKSLSCLVVDDEAAICQMIALALKPAGWETRVCTTEAKAREAVQEGNFDVALIDLRLGTRSGLDLLQPLLKAQPFLPVVIITAYASIPSAVEAMRRGATDYLPKPFSPAELRQAVDRALSASGNLRRRGSLDAEPMLESRHSAVQRLLTQARTAAESEVTVLLTGETGTGKGVLAKAIHDWGRRREGPFVVVACPSLSPELLASELFGHEKGAFTGAYRQHHGRLAQAEGGTLFLDEIGDMPMDLQSKLLRVLQTREYERLGGHETLKADVRILAATHINLASAVKEGAFRADLYYRLNGLELTLPPLRDRLDDLDELVSRKLKELRRENGKGPERLSKPSATALRKHAWPGNLRELHNVLERVSVLTPGKVVNLTDLPESLRKPRRAAPKAEPSGPLASVEEVEVAHIRKVVAASRSLEEAARILGMDYVTFWRRRKKYKI